MDTTSACRQMFSGRSAMGPARNEKVVRVIHCLMLRQSHARVFTPPLIIKTTYSTYLQLSEHLLTRGERSKTRMSTFC